MITLLDVPQHFLLNKILKKIMKKKKSFKFAYSDSFWFVCPSGLIQRAVAMCYFQT